MAKFLGYGKEIIFDQINLYECLINFCEVQVQSQTNSYFCAKCQQNVKFQKTYSFLALPNYLAIQLIRFRNDTSSKN